ncbi:phosphatase PAP2 family protein [Candidatus Gracilibacteria bacterium]|nr:phosphatase PAP2 family protein [Candidatus Gracilibacteria bacterium]
MFTSILDFDSYIIHNIFHIQNEFLDTLMIFCTQLGDLGFLWISLTCILVLLPKYRYFGIQISYALSLNLFLGEGILKHLFHRDRPFQDFQDILLKIPEPITSSFPSGHASASICFAVLFTYFFWCKSKCLVGLVWTIAIMISISRIYLQVHYPSDVLTGICIGILSSLIIIYIPSLFPGVSNPKKQIFHKNPQ